MVMSQADPTHWTITLDLDEGATVEYKYVRGTWDAGEGDRMREIANRRLQISLVPGASEPIVEDTVANGAPDNATDR